MSGVLLTAGYDRAWHSVYVAERLRRAGQAPALILLAYPASMGRMRTILRSRGVGSVLSYLAGREQAAPDSPMRAAVRGLGIGKPSLKAWARRYDVPLVIVGDLNGERAVRAAARLAPKVTAYTGGGILRRGLLEAVGRRVLNAHSGPLPAVRGMNALEWSVLLGQPTGVTIHLIDEGIDTGHALEFVDVPAAAGDTLESLRERLVLAGAAGMVRWVLRALQGDRLDMPVGVAAGPRQRQCFVVAPALRELAARRLAQRCAPSSQAPAPPVFAEFDGGAVET